MHAFELSVLGALVWMMSSADMREGARPYSRGAVIEPIPKALLDTSVADIHAQWKVNEEIRNRPPGWNPPKKKGKSSTVSATRGVAMPQHPARH